MKKNIPSLLLALFLFFNFSCSTDNESELIFPAPKTAGQSVNDDEIQLVFVCTPENHTFTIELETEEGRNIKINWGDNTKLKQYKNGYITHEYPAEDREYIITIQAPDIMLFELYDKESAKHTKSLFFGKCPKLTDLNLRTENNILEDFDLSKCTQFNGRMSLRINKPNFNFNGLMNFNALILIAGVEISPFKISNMKASAMEIFYKFDAIDHFEITECDNLNTLVVHASSSETRAQVDNFTLDAPNLSYLYLWGMQFNKDLDLSRISGEEKIALVNFDCLGKTIFSESPVMIGINNIALSEKTNVESLDFSNCKNLEVLTVDQISSLQELNTEGLEKLKYLRVSGSNYIPDYESGDSTYYPSSSSNMKTKASAKQEHDYLQLVATR